MPKIKNKTKQLFVVGGADGHETVAIPMGQCKEIPESMWEGLSKRPHIISMLDERKLLVIHEPSSAPKPGMEPPEPSNSWADLHWKKAQKLINDENDSANLYRLLEDEDRPKIKSMLEKRIEELEEAS